MYFAKQKIPKKDIFSCGNSEAFIALFNEKIASLRQTLGAPLLDLLENKGPHLIVVECETDQNIVDQCQDIVLSATITSIESWVAK